MTPPPPPPPPLPSPLLSLDETPTLAAAQKKIHSACTPRRPMAVAKRVLECALTASQATVRCAAAKGMRARTAHM